MQQIRGKRENTQEPLVSVVIPTWNSKSNINEFLSSVLDQNYPNVETIIVDGYSEDGILESARKYHVKILLKGTHRISL